MPTPFSTSTRRLSPAASFWMAPGEQRAHRRRRLPGVQREGRHAATGVQLLDRQDVGHQGAVRGRRPQHAEPLGQRGGVQGGAGALAETGQRGDQGRAVLRQARRPRRSGRRRTGPAGPARARPRRGRSRTPRRRGRPASGCRRGPPRSASPLASVATTSRSTAACTPPTESTSAASAGRREHPAVLHRHREQVGQGRRRGRGLLEGHRLTEGHVAGAGHVDEQLGGHQDRHRVIVGLGGAHQGAGCGGAVGAGDLDQRGLLARRRLGRRPRRRRRRRAAAASRRRPRGPHSHHGGDADQPPSAGGAPAGGPLGCPVAPGDDVRPRRDDRRRGRVGRRRGRLRGRHAGRPAWCR